MVMYHSDVTILSSPKSSVETWPIQLKKGDHLFQITSRTNNFLLAPVHLETPTQSTTAYILDHKHRSMTRHSLQPYIRLLKHRYCISSVFLYINKNYQEYRHSVYQVKYWYLHNMYFILYANHTRRSQIVEGWQYLKCYSQEQHFDINCRYVFYSTL